MKLARETIVNNLTKLGCPWESVLITESTDSTNKDAYELAVVGGKANTVIMTEYQKKGRGRINRIWNSDKEASVMFSIILRDERITSPGVLMLSAAAALRKAVVLATGVDDVLIKWPNDVFIGGKKCCGILAEAGKDKKGESFFVLGIGLNVNNEKSEFENLPNAASLFTVTGKKYDRNEVAALVLNSLYLSFEDNIENILSKCRDFSYTIGKDVCVQQQNQEIRGKAISIDNDGFLIVEDAFGKKHRIICGDVL